MGYLDKELAAYCQSDFYPFHMPGHKRRLGTLPDPYSFDLTEIEGFDNLHHAEGLIREAQQRAALFYGSSETHFLVNGSTCGILAAIGACVPEGKILMARNCHKAAYHGVYLNRLEAVYVYPDTRRKTENAEPQRGGTDCWGAISPAKVRQALARDPKIRAVFITSPTYEGVVSDVEEIARAAHEREIPLIVDEAHGAHFGMHPLFPESALRQGADVVIQSLHKTLPSLTQTALLHVNGPLVDRSKLSRMLGIYQSSSPSYVLMAGMDQCLRIMREQGRELLEALAENLTWFYKETQDLSVLRVIRTDDPSKILISSGSSGRSGREIGGILRRDYHLEVEMEAVSYVLALTSVGDTREGFERLARALRKIDGALGSAGDRPAAVTETESFCWEGKENSPEMTIWQAENAGQEKVLLEESAGCLAAEFVFLYPPGVPLLVPGERIREEELRLLLRDQKLGYSLQGMEDYSGKYLRVVKEAGIAGQDFGRNGSKRWAESTI